MSKAAIIAIMALAAMLPGVAPADEPEILDATATRNGSGWRFAVTVSHEDAGWEHYTDGWSIYAPDGRELGYRSLVHPHDKEQPFTRALSGVLIPPRIRQVTVRAHDTVHGEGPAFTVRLPQN